MLSPCPNAGGGAREAVCSALAAKQAAPLEPLALEEAAVEAIQAYHAARLTVVSLSEALLNVNGALAVIKEQALAANVSVLSAIWRS